MNNLLRNVLYGKLLEFLRREKKQVRTAAVSCDLELSVENVSLKALFPEVGSCSTLVVAVAESTIENESFSAFKERAEAFEKLYMRKDNLALDDYLIFDEKREEMVKKGTLRVYAKRIEFNLIEINAFIHDRGYGDENGFGVEPDTVVEGYLNLDGIFVSPIALLESRTNVNIGNWLKLGTNPVDAAGKVKIFPYDGVEVVYNMPGLFMLRKGLNVGLADKELNIVIPLSYRMIGVEANRLVWVRLHNNLCGVVDLNDNILIPPVYDYLSYIDDGKYKGLYVAELKGKHGLINKKNQVIMPFEEMDVKSISKKIKDSFA